jgi:predicted HTH transcriptional regulator
MVITAAEFVGLLNGGRETRAVEFKSAGPRVNNSLPFAFVARAVLAMANLPLGGWIILGIQDDGSLTGLNGADHATWFEHDELTAGLNAYADPFVEVDVEPFIHEGKNLVIIRVHEFVEVPVLARKDSPAKPDGKLVIRRGGCYVRPRQQAASMEVPTQTEMRELLDAAANKLLKRFLERAGVAGLLQAVPQPLTDSQKFDEQLGDFR